MTYIICEIGSNYRTEEEALLSVSAAARAGASAVKFQMFTERDLYGPQATFERRSVVNLPKLAERAHELKIDFLCTAFSATGVREVDPYVKRHKVASAEMLDMDILGAVKRTGKPIILSTGGHTMAEVHEALDFLGSAAERTTLLYCESAYPSNRYMPEKLALLGRETGLPVGLSDHTTEVYLTAWLCEYMGAAMLEKHVNFIPGLVGPDSPHSLDGDEFKEMVRYLKSPRFTVTDLLSDNEADMVTQHNRRLVATCDIPKGTTLGKGINFGSFRAMAECAQALSPFEWELAHGRVATRHIRASEGICEGDFS